jgi:hypothetical protein
MMELNLLRVHPFGSGLRLAGRGKDCARVEDSNPRCNVRGMLGAGRMGDA